MELISLLYNLVGSLPSHNGLQDSLRDLSPPAVRRRSLVRNCDIGAAVSDVVGELVSESVGLDEVDELRRRVSARMSSRLTLC